MNKLTTTEIENALMNLPNWTKKKEALHCQLTCKNFKEAFALMTRIAFEAEKQNHHPDWSNSYNTITIDLTTHDAGGLTEKDVKLATSIQAIIDKN